jgi:hypothetical protein
MNHGAALLEAGGRVRARLDEAKHWLRHEGSDLHRYGVEWTVPIAIELSSRNSRQRMSGIRIEALLRVPGSELHSVGMTPHG